MDNKGILLYFISAFLLLSPLIVVIILYIKKIISKWQYLLNLYTLLIIIFAVIVYYLKYIENYNLVYLIRGLQGIYLFFFMYIIIFLFPIVLSVNLYYLGKYLREKGYW